MARPELIEAISRVRNEAISAFGKGEITEAEYMSVVADLNHAKRSLVSQGTDSFPWSWTEQEDKAVTV